MYNMSAFIMNKIMNEDIQKCMYKCVYSNNVYLKNERT